MSTLTLYYNSKIRPSKNFKIDEINSYLSNLTKSTMSDFQYIKMNENLEFDKVVTLGQINLSIATAYNIDYASVTQNDTTFYYFITEKRWTSTSSIKLHFVLDTINTFSSWFTKLNKKTKVTREHKDRFFSIPVLVNVNTYPMFLNISSWVNINYGIRINGSIVKATNPHIHADSDMKIVFHCKLMTSGGITIDADVSIEATSFSVLSETDTDINYIIYLSIPDVYQSYYWDSYSVVLYVDAIITEQIYNLQRKVDLQSEGVLPILYKEDIDELTQPVDTSWYLYYKTAKVLSEEDTNAVTCQLIPEIDLNLKTDSLTGVITGNDINPYGALYFAWSELGDYDNRGAKSTFAMPVSIEYGVDDVVTTKWEMRIQRPYFSFVQYVIRLQTNSGDSSKLDLFYYKYYFNYDGNTLVSSDVELVDQATGLSEVKFLNVVSDDSVITCAIGSKTQLDPEELVYVSRNSSYSITFTSATPTSIYNLTHYDRTLSTLIKIIKIPYCPVDYEYDFDNDVFTMPPLFEFDMYEHSLVLEDINTKFSATIETQVSNPITTSLFLNRTISINDERNDDYESKLFHSDYYQIKFVYDSFSYIFPLEKIDVYNSVFNETFKFKFVMTSTMNSKFAFLFEDIVYSHSTEDYPNVLCVARNNEEVIYNSTYLNYLRTAYNYDLKAKERTIQTAELQTGLTIVGSVASVGLAIASQNPALIVSSVIGATASISSSVVNIVNTIAQQEANQESKLKQLQSQSVSVAGSDDVDIMTAYCNNRAKLCLYKVSERMKQALADLFYYTGYGTNEMKVPNLNTRVWFNYIAMNPVIDLTDNVPEIFVEDFKARCENGVTILHRVNTGVAPAVNYVWDINQEKENWEVSLL